MMYNAREVLNKFKDNEDYKMLCKGTLSGDLEESTYNHLYNQVESALIDEIDEVWDYITKNIEDTIASNTRTKNIAEAKSAMLKAIKNYNDLAADEGDTRAKVKFVDKAEKNYETTYDFNSDAFVRWLFDFN